MLSVGIVMGQTWVHESPANTNVLGNGLAVNPLNENVIYGPGSTGGAQVYISRNRGYSWHTFGTAVPFFGTGSNVIKSLAVNPRDTLQLLLGIENTSGIDAIMKTTDGGNSWIRTWGGTWYYYGKPVSFNPHHPDTVYTQGNDTLWRSTDFGSTWDTVRTTTGLFSTWCDAEIRTDSANIIYLGHTGSGIWKTTDYGKSWKKVFATNGEVPSIAIDPFNPRVAYATNWGGTYAVIKSTDAGETWHSIGAPGSNTGWWITCSTVDRGYVYYGEYAGTPGGIFVSADSGTSWRNFSAGFDSPALINLGLLALDSLTVIASQLNGIWKLVYPSSVHVTSPNGNEHWHGGGQYAVTWTDTNLISLKLDFTTDNGGTWNLLGDSLPASRTSYDWTLPMISSNQCRVRVVDALFQGGSAARDTSDTTFTIFVDTLTLFSPAGGESWDVGSTHNIVWVSYLLTTVNLDYSIDSGSTWISIAQRPAASSSYTWTLPATPSNKCLVRISDALDSTLRRTSGVFAINSVTEFTASLRLSDNGLNRDSLRFGILDGATDGVDASDGESPLGPRPPAGTFDTRWKLPDDQGTRTDIRDTLSAGHPDHLFVGQLQAGPSGFPFTISWKPESLRVGTYILRDSLTNGSIVSVDMRRDSSVTIANPDVSAFEILECTSTKLTFEAGGGWSMISVPLQVGDHRKSRLFPYTLSNAFGYQNGYVRVDTLQNGIGYWLKLTEATVLGCPQLLDTIDVTPGWNMIGSISEPVDVNDVVADPPSLIGSAYFGYNNGYVLADSIEPGKGYWLKARVPGKIVLAASPPVARKQLSATNPLQELHTLTVSGESGQAQTLFFGVARNGVEASFYEMPPVSPSGQLDVQFEYRRMVATHPKSVENSPEYQVFVNSPDRRINFSWRVENEKNFMYILVKKVRGRAVQEIPLTRTGSCSVIRSDHDSFVLKVQQASGSAERPLTYSLGEMYPNPFNPTTHFSVTVPTDAYITIKVFNTLGDEIAKLVDGLRRPGTYDIEWNGTRRDGMTVGSGVYYISMSATAVDGQVTASKGDFQSVRKVVFIK